MPAILMTAPWQSAPMWQVQGRWETHSFHTHSLLETRQDLGKGCWIPDPKEDYPRASWGRGGGAGQLLWETESNGQDPPQTALHTVQHSSGTVSGTFQKARKDIS